MSDEIEDVPEPDDQGQEETKQEVMENDYPFNPETGEDWPKKKDPFPPGASMGHGGYRGSLRQREKMAAGSLIASLGIKDEFYFTARGFMNYVTNTLKYTKDIDATERELINLLASILRTRR